MLKFKKGMAKEDEEEANTDVPMERQPPAGIDVVSWTHCVHDVLSFSPTRSLTSSPIVVVQGLQIYAVETLFSQCSPTSQNPLTSFFHALDKKRPKINCRSIPLRRHSTTTPASSSQANPPRTLSTATTSSPTMPPLSGHPSTPPPAACRSPPK